MVPQSKKTREPFSIGWATYLTCLRGIPLRVHSPLLKQSTRFFPLSRITNVLPPFFKLSRAFLLTYFL